MLIRSLAGLFIAFLLAIVSAGWGEAAPPTDAAIARRHSLTLDEVRQLKGFRGLSPQMLFDLPTARIRKLTYRLTHPKQTDALGAFEHVGLVRAGGEGIKPPDDAIVQAVGQARQLRALFTAPAARPASALVVQGTGTDAGVDFISVAGLPVGDSRPAAAGPAAGTARAGMMTLDYAPLLPEDQAPQRPQSDIGRRDWKWLGPTNIGGRTRAIVIHPTDARIMWAAGTGGGVWKSIDAGASWSPLADFMANINVISLALDPQNPNTLFAGTGEGTPNADAFRGMGLFRSLDGGATWAHVAATGGVDFHYVNRIAFTADGAALLLATRAGIFRSTNFRNADPAGIQLTSRAREPEGVTYGYMQVACNPRDAQVCVAGSYRARASISRDGGLTWSPVTGLPVVPPDQPISGRVELAFAAADPRTVYASVDVNQGEIWRSTDGGQTFQRRNTGANYLTGQGWYANTIWAGDPRRTDVVLVGGLDLARSTDGGQTLTTISDWRLSPRSAHADQHTIVAHPGFDGAANQIVYFGNDGGIYRHDAMLTAVAGSGWTALNTNYGITQFYGAAGNVKSGRVVGGTQDNGTLVYWPPAGSDPQPFRTTYGGDGAYAAADPEDANILYGATQWLGLHRSTNGGERSEPIGRGITEAGSPVAGQPRRVLFIAPFILDPANRTTLLAGAASLWRSRNVTAPQPTWQIIKPLVTVSGGPAGTPVLISAVEARRTDPAAAGSNLIWVGHTTGAIYRTSNGLADQPTWELLAASQNRLPRRFITRIRAHRSATATAAGAGTLFVTYGGYSKRNVWRSTDDGATWTDIHGTLPDVAVNDIAAHPRNPGWFYAATELGVFASADGGTTWAPTNQGPANVAVTELFWMGERMVAATHGRGMFWIDLSGAAAVSSLPPTPPGPAAPPSPAPPTPVVAPLPAAPPSPPPSAATPAPPPPVAPAPVAAPPAPAVPPAPTSPPPKAPDPNEILRSQ